MTSTAEQLREEVRRRSAESARVISEGSEASCCGSGDCCAEAGSDGATFVEAFYVAEQRGELDMTDEMLALARKSAADAGVRNAIFLKGVIEEIPLPADSVDVVGPSIRPAAAGTRARP